MQQYSNFGAPNEDEGEIKALVQEYERQTRRGGLRYFENDEFEDIIDYYEQRLSFDKALKVVEDALLQHPYCATFYIRKAQLLLDVEKFEQATEALEIATLYEPSNLDIFLTKAEILHQTAQYNEALELLQKARLYAEGEDLEDIFLLEAAIFESLGEHETALDSFLAVLKKNPRHELANVRLRLALETMPDLETVLPALRKLTDDDPYSQWAWVQLGYVQGQLGQTEEALEAFDYAMVINESFAFAHYDCIDVLMDDGRFAEALSKLEECVVLFGDDAETLCRIGECHEHLENRVLALQYYQKALQIDHLQGRVYYRIGCFYMVEEQWKTALTAFEQAAQADKENADFQLGMGQARAELFHNQQAHDYFQQAIALASDQLVYWEAYLMFLIKEGHHQTAQWLISTGRGYIDDVFWDYAQAVVSLSAGARQEGMLQLNYALQADSSQSQVVFDLNPDLEQDVAVANCLAMFR